MMQQAPVQQYPYSASVQQQHYAAHTRTNMFYAPNGQILSNYQAAAPLYVRNAFYTPGPNYPTAAPLNVQTATTSPQSLLRDPGPNYPTEAPLNVQNATKSPQLSFVVHFSPDQAATFLMRAERLQLASAPKDCR